MLNPRRVSSAAIGTEELQYDTLGTGPISVVFLHGLFGGPDNWHAIMEELSDDYSFYALQLPIDPYKDRQHKSFRSIGQLTDYVERFLDEMGLEHAVMCGNSLGGQIATDFALRHPQRVQGLILAGSAGLFERNVTSGKGLRYCRDVIRAQAQQVFYDPVHVTDKLVEDVYAMLADRQYRRFLLKVSIATRDRYMLEELKDVDVPTLIIWGRDDSITPPFVAAQFHQEMPKARLAFIDQCGHAPPIEQPMAFAGLLDSFLGGLECK